MVPDPRAEENGRAGDSREEAATPARETYVLTRWVFLQGLGMVYFCAFASLWPQVLGLVGSRGILPVRDFLHAVAAQAGPDRFHLVPTLLWLDPSDHALRLVCLMGMLLSLLLIAGILPLSTLAGLWLLYLSLVSIGQDFLSFQWDTLLLETGFLAIFFASGRILPRLASEPPSRLAVWLLRWLLFRLMFGSGVVKLTSGDPTWHGLTAMAYHYETQPLPTPLAWLLHLLPLSLQRFSTASVLVIELAAPFLIFGPRRLRLAGAGLLASLQILILLTGNFAFFNYLTIILCVPLLDDTALRRLVPARLRRLLPSESDRLLPPRARRWVLAPVAALALAIGVSQLTGELDPDLPNPVQSLAAWQEPLHLVNSYGLFAVMTTSHPVIAVEGSDDGRTWHEYGFRYQPQDVDRAPCWVAPFQPRLDWQMWFAALGSADQAPWFQAFLVRLLQGSPDVLGLLATNPFPHAPPRFVRAMLDDYRFTNAQIHRATGAWWQRRPRRLYFPSVSLRPSP